VSESRKGRQDRRNAAQDKDEDVRIGPAKKLYLEHGVPGRRGARGPGAKIKDGNHAVRKGAGLRREEVAHLLCQSSSVAEQDTAHPRPSRRFSPCWPLWLTCCALATRRTFPTSCASLVSRHSTRLMRPKSSHRPPPLPTPAGHAAVVRATTVTGKTRRRRRRRHGSI
jgi:hypothetical protein